MATTDLGKWMITNGGNYDPEATYEQLTMVMYNNSTYITLKTVTGVTPSNDEINYILMAQGFAAEALSSVTATDTSGLLGESGKTVSAQSLVDYLADAVATKLLKKTDISTVDINSDDKVPSSSLVHAINSNLSGKFSLVQSGSFDDIKSSGLYFVANAVSDKPLNVGGLYSLSSADSNATNKVGIYIANNAQSSPSVVGSIVGEPWSYKLITNKSFNIYTFEKTGISVPANGEIMVEFDIARSGYSVLGAVGFTSSNSYAVVSRVQTIYSGNEVNMTLRNVSSNQVTTVARVQVLYIAL